MEQNMLQKALFRQYVEDCLIDFHHTFITGAHFHGENCAKVCNVIKWSKVKVIACEHRHTVLGMAN